MKTGDKIKEEVKEKYSEVAKGNLKAIKSISGSCCGGDKVVVDMALKYGDADRDAIPDGADLGLGCGTPTAFADIKEGMTVLDLGSGAGIDCFIASKYVGSAGKVIGVDMTEAMIRKANENKAKVNAANVEFRLGEIESLPVENNAVDRVISNCVINLVPDKEVAFREIHRVLKLGGKFTVSDIVVDGEISDEERRDASLWAGCISGAMDRKDYLAVIEKVGFKNVQVTSEKKYDYKLSGGGGLYSITVVAAKE
ncbi:MAG: arsenite methyltransferase [Bacteroidetes bacterium]|nr:arsenite methyltransferase [Bacteroidota bacterium]MCL5737761.1 arsenite methyltransferase [Bacteroidota bacterium]